MEGTKGRKAADAAMDQMISFSVGTEQYGVDIRKVREVILPGEITPLPRAPDFVKGMINLRGDVIPVIDLRDKLGRAGGGRPGEDRIIVVEISEKLIGMIVDAVSHVLRVAPGQLEPTPPWLGGLTGEYITGVVRQTGGLIVVLNVDTILTSGEKLALENMTR